MDQNTYVWQQSMVFGEKGLAHFRAGSIVNGIGCTKENLALQGV